MSAIVAENLAFMVDTCLVGSLAGCARAALEAAGTVPGTYVSATGAPAP